MLAAEAELKALMIAGLAGDEAAYRVLLTALGDVLRRYYMRRIGADDAEDLVQEALIALHTRRATYDREQAFTPWLYAIARYKLLDHMRRARVRATVPLDDQMELAAQDETEAASARRDLDRMLETLSPETQAMIRKVKIEGFTTQEAAAQSGRSEISVRVGIHRGLKSLANNLRGGTSREDK